MRASEGGGGGDTIVVDIPGTRAASTKVGQAAQAFAELARRIASYPLPEMPGDAAAVVEAALADAAGVLGRIPNELVADAQELRVRALWAEIADRLMAGESLSGSDLNEFKSAYAHGLIDKYAEPWQRDLADAYAKKLYDEEHPGGLTGFLHAAEHDLGDFFSGAWDAIKDPAVMIYHLTPMSGGDFLKNWENLGEGLANGVEHPLQFAKAIANVDALEQRGFSYWLGNLAPTVAVTLLSGGAGAAARGATGVTALERAGLTADAVEGLSQREAAAVIMRGAKPVPGMVAADGGPVADTLLQHGASPLDLYRKEAENFTGDPAISESSPYDLWLGNGHDSTRPLLGEHPGRSMKYGADSRDVLRSRSEEEYRSALALPPAWGGRDEMSIVHVPAGQQGWRMIGETAPQMSDGVVYPGGAQQYLFHTLRTDNVVWTGPPPWARVPDLAYAAHGAAHATGAAAAGLAVTHPAAVGGVG